MSTLLDKPAEACRLVREGQLEALRELWRINRRLLLHSREMAPAQIAGLLDRYDLVIAQLKDLMELLTAYRCHGLFTVDSLLDNLIQRRMKRAARTAGAVQAVLDSVLQRMPRSAPLLRFDRDGRLQGE